MERPVSSRDNDNVRFRQGGAAFLGVGRRLGDAKAACFEEFVGCAQILSHRAGSWGCG